MAKYLYKLTTAITRGSFDAILKDLLEIHWDFCEIMVEILYFSVTYRVSPDFPSPKIFVTVCHRWYAMWYWHDTLRSLIDVGEGVFKFAKIFRPRSLLGPPSLKMSDQDVFRLDLLFFQFFLIENAYLTPIWRIFTWHYSSIGLINDI